MGKKYFSSLNYTLGNEDSTVEVEMIKQLLPKSIFSVCGSGGRSIPLTHKDAERIYLCDLSTAQLKLAELRYVTYKNLTVDDFLLFWGYYPFGNSIDKQKRSEIFYKLPLSKETKNFFTQLFLELDFNSLLYLGKWEKTFSVLAKICSMFLGKKTIEKLFSFKTLDEQVNFYKNEFPMYKWKMVLFLLGNKSVFNALLYKGDFIKKNDPDTHFQYYFNAFDRLFTTGLARESFFLNLCFFGKINFLEGNPIESVDESINRVKDFSGDIFYINQDMISFLSSAEVKFDFLSLSDVPSYFSGNLEKDFLQKIKPSLNKDAIVVIRYYLRKCEADTSGYRDVTNNFSALIRHEKVQMYKFCIYQLA